MSMKTLFKIINLKVDTTCVNGGKCTNLPQFKKKTLLLALIRSEGVGKVVVLEAVLDTNLKQLFVLLVNSMFNLCHLVVLDV